MTEREQKKSRKRKTPGDAEEKKNVVTLLEWPDAEALRQLYELHLPAEIEAALSRWYQAFKAQPSQRMPVEYIDRGNGIRLMANGFGLQKMKRWMRKAVSWRHYYDLDFRLCGPTLLHQLLKRHGHRNLYLAELVEEDREKFYKRVCDDREKAKEETNAVLWGKVSESSVLQAMGATLRATYHSLVQLPCYRDAFEAFQESGDKGNMECAFMCNLVFRKEREALEVLLRVIRENHFTVGVLACDGCMVERVTPFAGPESFSDEEKPANYDPFPRHILDLAKQKILEETTMDMTVVEKDLRMSREDWELFNGPRVLKKITPASRVPIYLLNRAGRGLMRQGPFVMRLHPRWTTHKRVVFTQAEDAKDFINQTLKEHLDTFDMGDMMRWFQEVDAKEFPLLKENVCHVAFLDRRLDMVTREAEPWEDVDNTICTHFFLAKYGERPTPLWDNLLKTQLPFLRTHEAKK